MKCNCSLCHYITASAYTLLCSLCFYTKSRELTSQAEGACRPKGPLAANGGGGTRWGVVGLARAPPAARPISWSLALFTPASELNVNQERWRDLAQWYGRSHHEGRSTPPFESATRNREKREKAIERRVSFRE